MRKSVRYRNVVIHTRGRSSEGEPAPPGARLNLIREMAEAHFEPGDQVRVEVSRGRIVITKAEPDG